KATLSEHLITSRKRSPTSLNAQGKISGPERSGRRRCQETMEVAQVLHGATPNNMLPAFEGIMSVLNNNCSVPDLVELFKKCPKLSQGVIPKVLKEKIRNFEKSDSNFIRSVNVLYKGGIASKQKYISIKSSLSMGINENGKLMARVNQINIGDLYDVKEVLCQGLSEEYQVNGKFRNLQQLLLKMAQFYLSINKYRKDKLDWFGEGEGAFKVAIGGDGAPFGKDDQAVAWLVSFLNCRTRVCSPAENFLLFGANCSEDCEPVHRYTTLLREEMTAIEGNSYSVEVEGNQVSVSFHFELLPNDMKYLAFLGGELTISATYFSPFADISKSEINDVQGSFGLTPDNKWKPWKYNDRIKVADAVTSFIAQKKSRQEFPPLVGKFIDRAKAEPLHLKNNAWQQWNLSVLKYALSRSDVSTCKSIVDIPPESCFGRYYNCLRFHVKATRLAKKVRKWFADGREKNKDLDYRFTGKESRLFCHNFMSIVKNLRMDSDQRSHTFQLHVFAHIAINLRDAVSLFSRVSISNEQVLSLQQFCSNYYRTTSLFLTSTPTTWTIGHIVPSHTKAIHERLGLGLGINSMEGREAKHVTLAKFTQNTQFSNRWAQVFKHEYVSLFWLRENGCDETVHKKTSALYVPKRCSTSQFCHCGEPKQVTEMKCSFCSDPLRALVCQCVAEGKTSAAKDLLSH
ncbi:unnamed protein product, partial [Porites evermanni]